MWFIYPIWGIVTIYLNHLASQISTCRAKKLKLKQPLPDVLHDHLLTLPNHVPDYLLLLCILYILLLGYHVNETDLIRFLCSLTLRPLFMCQTTFPSCYQHGVDFENKNASWYSRLFLSKHDLMFSGHTCLFMFFGSTVKGPVGWIMKYLMPWTLVAARYHYTIDITVAMTVYHAIPSVLNTVVG